MRAMQTVKRVRMCASVYLTFPKHLLYAEHFCMPLDLVWPTKRKPESCPPLSPELKSAVWAKTDILKKGLE